MFVVHGYSIVGLYVALNDGLGEKSVDMRLDIPFQRTRAVLRVVTVFRDGVFRSVGNMQVELAFSESLSQIAYQ